MAENVVAYIFIITPSLCNDHNLKKKKNSCICWQNYIHCFCSGTRLYAFLILVAVPGYKSLPHINAISYTCFPLVYGSKISLCPNAGDFLQVHYL